MTEKKIRVPAGEAMMREKAERERFMGEMREYLDAEQRKAAAAEPFGHPKIRIPANILGELSAAEREELHSFEEQAFHRHQEQARHKDSEKRYWEAAGGDGEHFERRWRESGEEEAIARRAAEMRERAERSSTAYG